MNQTKRDGSRSCRNDFLTVSGPSAPRRRIHDIIQNVSAVLSFSCAINHCSCTQACWVTLTHILTCSHKVIPTLKHSDDQQNRSRNLSVRSSFQTFAQEGSSIVSKVVTQLAAQDRRLPAHAVVPVTVVIVHTV